jgi:hypothetical protein
MEFEYELFPFHKYKKYSLMLKTNDLQDENLIGRPLDSGINQEPHLRLKRIFSILSLKYKTQRVSQQLLAIYYCNLL